MNLKTERGMKKLFKFVNRELFNNELTNDVYFKPLNLIEMIGINQVQFNGKIPFDGITVVIKKTCFVGVLKDLPKQEFLDTFVHELIHVWQYQNNKDLDHKKEFNKWGEKAYELFYQNIEVI